MATIKILPGNDTLPQDNNNYIRSLKYQMILNSLTSLTTMEGVQSMHASVMIKVVEGAKCPYKRTHLKRELLSLRLSPTWKERASSTSKELSL